MKLHMGEKITLYDEFDKDGKPVGAGKTFNYDDIITQTVQYQVRHANRELQRATGKTTNKVALTYPAIFHSGQRAHLVSLVEKATLEDGTRLEVVGTIMEPAAAALNYLAEQPGVGDVHVAMVADLGAGTFDLSLVEAYPNGQVSADGKSTCYYDVKWNDGTSKVAGLLFTEQLYKYALEQVPFSLRKRQQEDLLNDVEQAKRRLSEYETTVVTVSGADEDVDIELSRVKFEELTAELMKEIVAKIRTALDEPSLPNPATIVITGGASRMPMVARIIEESFPEYAGKVVCHKPGEAIAHGAARYATKESSRDVTMGKAQAENDQTVRLRTVYDLGICYLDTSKASHPPFISILVPAGSELPFTSRKILSSVVDPTRYSRFAVMEANCKKPGVYETERDWREVVVAIKDHGKVIPTDTPSEARIIVDKNSLLVVEVTDPRKPMDPPVKAESTNVNLTNF